MIKQSFTTISISISLMLFACDSNKISSDNEYQNKIIGQWKQVKSFDLIDDTITPNIYDWLDVQDGFILELLNDGNFIYTKNESCTTGVYLFDESLSEIEFNFDCEIDFYGEKITKLTEFFEKNNSQNNTLVLYHKLNPNSSCIKTCNSILERIE